MLTAMTIIETGKTTYKKGEEIKKSDFKAGELKQLIKDGAIADLEEIIEKTDSEDSVKIEYTSGEGTSDTEEGGSKNDEATPDGKEADTEEK
jgi:hypothetical protein